ncbi:11501_t:CDS:1, partial [Racocetra fulgida]
YKVGKSFVGVCNLIEDELIWNKLKIGVLVSLIVGGGEIIKGL